MPNQYRYGWGLRWLDPLEMPKFAYAGTDYHDILKMLLNKTMHDLLIEREPFEGGNQRWKVQEWWKKWIFCINFESKSLETHQPR